VRLRRQSADIYNKDKQITPAIMKPVSLEQAEMSFSNSLLTTKNLTKQNRKILEDWVCANEGA
jgi:hypothetical protein